MPHAGNPLISASPVGPVPWFVVEWPQALVSDVRHPLRPTGRRPLPLRSSTHPWVGDMVCLFGQGFHEPFHQQESLPFGKGRCRVSVTGLIVLTSLPFP